MGTNISFQPKLKPVLVLGISLLLLSSIPNIGISALETEPIPIIIDTDVGTDDILAILFLICDPSVSIKAITVSTGVSYVENGVNNILKMLDYLDIEDIPVAGGQDKALVSNHTFPTVWRDGSNSFYGVALPSTNLKSSELNASELIISRVNASPSKLSIIALGPLTNIAQALQKDPSIKEKIELIHIMGGAVTVDGNVGYEYPDIPNFVAEWNIYIDPQAADIVFKSNISISLVPLDATNDVPQTQDYKTYFEEVADTIEAELALKFITPGLYFWDALAAVAFVNSDVVTWDDYFIDIELDLENHEGQTKVIEGVNPNSKIAVSADLSLFEVIFLDTLNYEETISKDSNDASFISVISTLSIMIIFTGSRKSSIKS